MPETGSCRIGYSDVFCVLKVSFYAEEDTLQNLYCGRQYHMVMYQTNYIGESEASQIINTRYKIRIRIRMFIFLLRLSIQ